MFLTKAKFPARVMINDTGAAALGTWGCSAERKKTMGWIGYLLLVFGGLWLAQIVGTYFQMEHYRKVLGGIRDGGGDGFVGVGNAKARFGKGVILILVVGPDGVVGRALRMRGMTVFARFGEVPDLVGMSLDELREEGLEEPYEKGTMLAARRAVEQIDQVKLEKAEAVVG